MRCFALPEAKNIRSELAPFYEDEPALKALFTERLRVPMSVRFAQGEEAEGSDEPTVDLPPGQPFWLSASTEGRQMVKRAPPAHSDRPAAQQPGEGARATPQEQEEPEPEEGGLPPQVAAALRAVDDRPEDEEPGSGAQPAGRPAAEDEGEKSQPPPGSFGDWERPAAPNGTGPGKGPGPGPQAGAEPGVSSEPDAVEPEGDVPPPPTPELEPLEKTRGVAMDGRRERRRLLEKLARSVMTSNDTMMNAAATRIKHRPEECHDCNPQHDLDRIASLEGSSPTGAAASIPIWVEREGRQASVSRVRAAHESGSLAKFAGLLTSLAQLFSVSCEERVHIFEEDTQTVAFNGGALFFNLRYFETERHAESWEDAVSFWAISFSHELAHFESVVHDRRHGRAMEAAQRAMLPALPRVLARPWGLGAAAGTPPWRLKKESADAV